MEQSEATTNKIYTKAKNNQKNIICCTVKTVKLGDRFQGKKTYTHEHLKLWRSFCSHIHQLFFYIMM
jgi:hypothetical protein